MHRNWEVPGSIKGRDIGLVAPVSVLCELSHVLRKLFDLNYTKNFSAFHPFKLNVKPISTYFVKWDGLRYFIVTLPGSSI